jgi:hypothetical protein
MENEIEIRKSWGIIYVKKKYCSHHVLGYGFDSFVFKETGIQDLQSESQDCICVLIIFVMSAQQNNSQYGQQFEI